MVIVLHFTTRAKATIIIGSGCSGIITVTSPLPQLLLRAPARVVRVGDLVFDMFF
jgi:hypothetical protein